jgi:integrase
MAHFLEVSDVLKLLAEAKKESESDWLMIYLAFRFALRAHEVVGGRQTWKNKKTGEKVAATYSGLRASNVIGTKLVVKRLKNSNPVEDELDEHQNPLLNGRKALLELCRSTPPNQRLFPMTARTFQRRMHMYGERAGLPKLFCHPHTLKSSVIDHLRSNLSLEELQIFSGHKSLNSLSVYMNPKKSVVDAKVGRALASIGV